jgi:hypothetical protein
MVEYDLGESSFEHGIKLKGSRVRAEQSAIPTAMIWYPLETTEGFVMTVRVILKALSHAIGQQSAQTEAVQWSDTAVPEDNTGALAGQSC